MHAYPALISVLLLGLAPSSALDNGLALTPPMGWLSWLWLECKVDCEKHPSECLSEDVIRTVADRMAADGFKEAGYEYLIIDDCWLENKRDKNGKMVPDRKRFKSGMKALADYIHRKGLKFGIYQDIGNYTCQKAPGVKGHEKADIDTFVEWEVDYIKIDGCYEEPEHMNQSYPAFGQLLNETGRPILYSCSWPAYVPDKSKDYKAMEQSCNIWRNYDDIASSWSSLLDIMDWFGSQPELADFAGPGHYHDPDMLVIGNSPITIDQARAQIAVWSILAAPLLISADLTKLDESERKLLLNRAIIDIDQCPCKMGKRLSSKDDVDIWQRVIIEGNTTVIALVNRGYEQKNILVTREDLGLDEKSTYLAIDLFKEDADQELTMMDGLNIRVKPTGAVFFKLVKLVSDADNDVHSVGT